MPDILVEWVSCLRNVWGAGDIVKQDEAPFWEHTAHIGCLGRAHEHQAIKWAPAVLHQP